MFRKEAEKEGHSVLILDSLSLALLDEGDVIEIDELLPADNEQVVNLQNEFNATSQDNKKTAGV